MGRVAEIDRKTERESDIHTEKKYIYRYKEKKEKAKKYGRTEK